MWNVLFALVSLFCIKRSFCFIGKSWFFLFITLKEKKILLLSQIMVYKSYIKSLQLMIMLYGILKCS